jgi:hypothetical protein
MSYSRIRAALLHLLFDPWKKCNRTAPNPQHGIENTPMRYQSQSRSAIQPLRRHFRDTPTARQSFSCRTTISRSYVTKPGYPRGPITSRARLGSAAGRILAWRVRALPRGVYWGVCIMTRFGGQGVRCSCAGRRIIWHADCDRGGFAVAAPGRL